MPETFVRVHHQLARLGHALQRFALQHQILAVVQIAIEHGGVENEKTAVDVTGAHLGLFVELDNGGAFNGQLAEPAGRMNASERGRFAVGLVKFSERADVNVADTVAVGQAENAVCFQIPSGAPEPRAGHGLFAGVHQRLEIYSPAKNSGQPSKA